MNQDFHCSKKKQHLSEKKKKLLQRGSPKKEIPAQAVSENKQKSWKLKIPPPPRGPITFLMVRPLLKVYNNGKCGRSLDLII